MLKNPAVLFVALVFVFGFLYVRAPKNTFVLNSYNEQSKSELAIKNETLIVPKESVSSTTSLSLVTQSQKRLRALMAKGVIPIPIQVGNSNLNFTVTPMPVGFHCSPGDFDLMQVMSPTDKTKIFTISVESMSRSGLKQSQSYSLADIKKNVPLVVELPTSDGAYGLYLCEDSKQKRRCSDSPPLDPRTWGQNDKKTRQMAEGRNLYFQLLVVKGGAAYVIPGVKWGKKNLEKLTQDLEPWLGSLTRYLDDLNAKLQALSPMPAVVQGKELTVPLKFMEGRCG